jgi:hypothetical protein
MNSSWFIFSPALAGSGRFEGTRSRGVGGTNKEEAASETASSFPRKPGVPTGRPVMRAKLPVSLDLMYASERNDVAKLGPNSDYAGSEGAQLLNADLLEKSHPLRLKIAWIAMTWSRLRCATRFYFTGAGESMKAFPPPNFGDGLPGFGNLKYF